MVSADEMPLMTSPSCAGVSPLLVVPDTDMSTPTLALDPDALTLPARLPGEITPGG